MPNSIFGPKLLSKLLLCLYLIAMVMVVLWGVRVDLYTIGFIEELSIVSTLLAFLVPFCAIKLLTEKRE